MTLADYNLGIVSCFVKGCQADDDDDMSCFVSISLCRSFIWCSHFTITDVLDHLSLDLRQHMSTVTDPTIPSMDLFSVTFVALQSADIQKYTDVEGRPL
jgi:hypothetical protein